MTQVDWQNDENVDFSLLTGNAADGVIWITLKCSVHGNMASHVEWDAGYVNIAIERHYAEKHQPTTGEVLSK